MYGKVSIITPAYNSAAYIESTINSVINQTYSNWEMIIADDGSDDDTVDIAQRYARQDERIILIKKAEHSGTAQSRNIALNAATGRYIAYLDADDIWKPEKLEKQLAFMTEKNCAFSCASYEVIDDAGHPKGKYIHQLPKVDYKGFLLNNLIQTVGVMADTALLDKKYLVMPNMKRRQDAATWLQVLNAGYECYGLWDILCEYRRANNSLSHNKFRAVQGMWKLYREVEHLSVPFSALCFVRYAAFAVWKRIYIGRKHDA